MNPTRRSVFAALANVAPAGDDPIYAAIERHRAAWNAAEAAMDDMTRHEVERTAAEALAATVPASRAGIRALLGIFFATWSAASRRTRPTCTTPCRTASKPRCARTFAWRSRRWPDDGRPRSRPGARAL
jgi:hypothetical protein